jgi:hypothetical protein
MAGLKVVAVKTHADGNLDLEDLKSKAEQHKDNLAAFMVYVFYFSAGLSDIPKRSRILQLSECSRMACKM